jgi:hypothetical protein
LIKQAHLDWSPDVPHRPYQYGHEHAQSDRRPKTDGPDADSIIAQGGLIDVFQPLMPKL